MECGMGNMQLFRRRSDAQPQCFSELAEPFSDSLPGGHVVMLANMNAAVKNLDVVSDGEHHNCYVFLVDQSQSQAVNVFVKKWLNDRHGNGATWQSLAELVGVSKTHVYNMAKGRSGVGAETEAAVARIDFGGSVDALRKAAQKHLQEHPIRTVEPVERDEELQRAVYFLRGQLPDEYLDDAAQSEFFGGNQFTRDALVLMIRAGYAQWKESPKKRAGGKSDADILTERIEKERNG
jgi:hypothetical protein